MMKLGAERENHAEIRRQYYAGQISTEDYVKKVLSSKDGSHEHEKIMRRVDRMISRDK